MKGSLYEKSAGDCLAYLGKRCILLAAKLVGFKSVCLALTTVLLYAGIISEEAWVTLAVTVVCSASGIRLADSFKDGIGGLYERSYKRFKGKGFAKSDAESDSDSAFDGGWNGAKPSGATGGGIFDAGDDGKGNWQTRRKAASVAEKVSGKAEYRACAEGKRRIRALLAPTD